ncbi:MAG: glycosyltransferase family 4 protein [Acidobacteriaceae bacterium]|nr:glycosyltransferase family 4 protein [Acidobacteriaceae bacterium]
MKILHIDTGRGMRGGQIQVMLLLRALQQAGHACTLLARQRSPLWHAAQAANVPTFAAGLASLWRKSKAFDIVHAHDAQGHTMAAIASRRPFVVSRRVAFPVNRSLASKWKYRRASRYLAVSEFVGRELSSAGIPADKIDLVYDAVEIEQQAPPWDATRPAVALATSDARKGRTLVERAAHMAGVPVLFSTDLKRDLLNASTFVYISQSEGLGSAALLAMGMGVPVIASRVEGLAEVFEHNLSGLYVANQAEQIARAMRTVRDNPALAATLIAGGKVRVQERFSSERLVEATLKSYERVLGG